jgi:putative protease
MEIPELLAPAPTFACAQAAFDNGADAVYAGLSTHNLRARSGNFDVSDLEGLLGLARDAGRSGRGCGRVYIALNVMPDDSMVPDIERSLKSITDRNCLPDAFIVSDPGVVALCRQHSPAVPLHLSTQTGTFNSASAGFWSQQGIRRVILPREMTLDAIQKIAASGLAETEVFVHGAMCVSISGRCLLGVYMRQRHPNFGDCPQSCRLRYSIAALHGPEETLDGSEQWYTVEETPGQAAFILNSKDLNALPVLDRIVSTGVTAVKIEGRHRSLHYVASVVKVYRAALDSIARSRKDESYTVLPQWQEELDRLDHRPYTTGFYAGDYTLQDLRRDSRLDRRYRVVGVVRELLDEKGPVVDVKNPFLPGDSLSVLSAEPGAIAHDATVLSMQDINGNSIQKALTNRLVVCTASPALQCGDILRKKKQEE